MESPQNGKAGKSLGVSGPYSTPSWLHDGLDGSDRHILGAMSVPGDSMRDSNTARIE
jgi:hypothetical protein